jgi:hypothetical protein
VVLLVMLPVFIWMGFLLPGAATLVAWDCLGDLDCSFALAGRGQSHPRPTHHAGGWAIVMGGLLGAIGVLISGGIARGLLMFKWLEPPMVAVVPLTLLILAVDVAAVRWIEALL